VTGSDKVHRIGFKYVAFPSAIGSVILVTMGIVLNNMSALPTKKYPIYWFPWSREESGAGEGDVQEMKEPNIIPSEMNSAIEVVSHSNTSLDDDNTAL
jgi:CBS-domain-containing membrane protein